MSTSAESFSYNGVTFASLYRTSISSRPIQDEAQRTTVYVEHVLTVEGFLAGGTDTTLAAMRKLLTQPAGSLVYTAKGFGDLTINTPGAPKLDAKWGPVPELLEWVGLGGDGQAARVTWKCTIRIPECDFARYNFAVLALNWTVDHDIDQDGYTTESVRGYLEIPITRRTQQDRTVPDSVDRYRELLETDVKQGFQRSRQSFKVSADRRRLDFSWVDTELSLPYPNQVTVADANHTVRTGTGQGQGLVNWSITFDARITMARGARRDLSLITFLNIVSSRMRALLGLGGAQPIPRDFEIRDSIFGRETTFRYVFELVHHGPVKSFVNLSGLWDPIAGTSYDGWQASLTALRTNSSRGWAGLKVLPSDDVIVDLCANSSTQQLSTLGSPPPGKGNQPDGNLFEATLKTILRNLDPENSWTEYQIEVVEEEYSNVVRHKPSPAIDRTLSTGDPFGNPSKGPRPLPDGVLGPVPIGQKASAADDAVGAIGAPSKNGPNPPDYFQRAATPTRRIALQGFAVRVGYRVPVPRIVSVGGIAAVEEYRWAAEKVISSIGDIPVFRTAWQIWYMLADAPAGPLPWPANPVLGTDGGFTGNQGDLKP